MPATDHHNSGQTVGTADRIRALRLWLHRRLDRLYERATDPAFTGKIVLELPSKCGRPGEPTATTTEYGLTDI